MLLCFPLPLNLPVSNFSFFLINIYEDLKGLPMLWTFLSAEMPIGASKLCCG